MLLLTARTPTGGDCRAFVQDIKPRSLLRRYSQQLLTRMESAVTAGAVMSYALWSSGPAFGGASTPWMLLTLPFVLYGIFRYQLLSDPNDQLANMGKSSNSPQQTERPEEILLKDHPIQLTVIIWILLVFTILWLNSKGII